MLKHDKTKAVPSFSYLQGGSGTEPEPETGTVGTVFPETDPEGPRIEKIQSREAILKESSFQYRMKVSIENGFIIPGRRKTGPGIELFNVEPEPPEPFSRNLRKSAVFCENLRFPNASFSRKRRESAKSSENLRKSAFGLGLSH